MKKLLGLMLCLMISLSVIGAAFAESPTEDPYGRYDETIVYTTGYVLTDQGADTLKGTPYEKDTPSNNAYTRYILAVLNVQNENIFEATPGDSYDQKVSLAIASRTIPDIMFIEDYSILAELVEEDMVEDLTAVYNAYACDTVRAAYASYGDNNPLNTVTFDGKIMAIPKTQLSDAQSFLWLRKDWLDKLGLEIPHTTDEVAAVLKAFIEQDPNGTGAADTIGLPVLNTLYGGYPNNHFAIDNFFTAFDAYPDIWIRNGEGEVVYGSVQPEMKDALALLRDWYAQGLIDKEFTTRTYDDIVAMIASGRCGAYVGPWWSPFNPAQTSSYANNGAEWINVTAPVDSDGRINGINTKPYAGFVVVRKGYAHPEIAMKIVNVISEYSKLDTSDAVKEVKDNQSIAYFNWPLYCQVQRGDNAQLMSQHVKAVLDGEADVSTLTTEEASYYESAVNFLAAEAEGKKAQSADYSQYMSRMVAIYRIIDEPANFMTPAFFETTEMMAMRWASLEKMELETVLKIIVGDNDLSSFDSFVSNWERAGGSMITEEVREATGD
ncbi:MAG: extracellular solute-binding protein [Clostridia bacterium]|nr:extracellular solute-binding protein [Clostridia bacterium]